MSLRIKNIQAATLYEYNLGLRDKYVKTDAMFCDSLFSDYILKNGMRAYKGKSTRDIICLDFGFGTRSYDQELEWAKKNNPERVSEIESNKDKYVKLTKLQLREIMYREGVEIKYPDGEIIHYQMLYRNPSKAKTGQVMFINSDLYDKASHWLTMGLKGKTNKIVELSAYAPLTTSTIIGKLKIPVKDVLILKDAESFYETVVDVVNNNCEVTRENRVVKNVVWDGMALIDESVCPEWVNGMCLLRNHFFKACAFKTRLQKFFKDNGMSDRCVFDAFGRKHYLRDIKIVTTESAAKWLKFKDLISYDEWKKWAKNTWGIVKTDHRSKLGEVQQMSYQMINTLPCRYPDISDICRESVEYASALKNDDEVFLDYLDKNATVVNNYKMLKSLYLYNAEIGRTKWFIDERRNIVNGYISKLRKGKIIVNGDNLTVCGNPYGLLLYSIGKEWEHDPTLNYEDGAIECYTKRFKDGEYLCAMRSPHNSPNNIAYFHNVYSEEMEKYFCFSDNIMAVNCINTDVQDRMNGEDFDSDFNFVSNNPILVHCAKECYHNYPTVVNAINDDNKVYGTSPNDYALMDDISAKAQADIGESSNLAQLAMSYYWTEKSKANPDENVLKDLYNNFVVLAVLAQLAIDGIKRTFDVNVRNEINRIKRMDCMNMYDGQPAFMKYIKEVKAVDDAISCPMNWVEICLNTINRKNHDSVLDIRDFICDFDEGKRDRRKASQIRQLVVEYYVFIKNFNGDNYDVVIDETEKLIKRISGLKLGKETMNFLIKASFGINHGVNNRDCTLYIRNRRRLLNVLYRSHPDNFINNFETTTL